MILNFVCHETEEIENQPRLKNFHLNLILTCNIHTFKTVKIRLGKQRKKKPADNTNKTQTTKNSLYPASSCFSTRHYAKKGLQYCNWLRHHFLQDTETENSLYMNYCFSCNKQNYFLLQQGYIFWYGFSVLMCC